MVLLIGCSPFANAQQNGSADNTFYADFASRDVFYSINYERVFSHGKKFSKSYRVGFSVFSNILAVPLGIHFFTGQGNNHLEFELNIVPFIEDYKRLFSAGNLSDKKLDIIPGVGYRFQKVSGGFFLRIIAAPIVNLDPRSDDFWKMDGKVYPGVSVGVGISF